MTPIPKKDVLIKVRGERTFEVHFSAKEVEQIVLKYFSIAYESESQGMDLDITYDNDGSLIVSGHQDIKAELTS